VIGTKGLNLRKQKRTKTATSNEKKDIHKRAPSNKFCMVFAGSFRGLQYPSPDRVLSLNHRLIEGTQLGIINAHSKNFSFVLASFNVFIQPVV